MPLILACMFLCGCSTFVSISIDCAPTLTPQQISSKIAACYDEIGFKPTPLPGTRYLESWSVDGGFVSHSVRDGKLNIWIAPRGGGWDKSTAVRIEERVRGIIDRVAPFASVQVRTISKLDFR